MVMSSNNDELGVRERITAAVLEATDERSLSEIRQGLKDAGLNEGSIKAVVSELRKKGRLKFGELGLATIGKGSLDEVMRGLIIPEVVNGRRDAFNAGVVWATRSILTGVRLAQELSSLAISQAKPLIDMAKEMRPDASQIAKETGLAMGGEMAGKMFDFMEQRIPAKADIATVADPMKGLMARTMETMMNRLTGMMSGTQVGPAVGPAPGFVDKRAQQ
jgi:hypothetical protein